MNFSLISRWRQLLRLSGAYKIASFVFIGSALVLAAWIPKLVTQGDVLRAAVEAKASVKLPSTAPALVSRIPVGQQIGEFVSAFPPLSHQTEDLRAVFQSAKRHNLQLARGDYQFKEEASAPLVVLSATFPLTAEYARIKDFTADVLRTVPNVSMDELRMTRNAAGSTELESVVRFSFVYQRH
jgi:hypothetical protein